MLNLVIVEDEVNTLLELTNFIPWTEIGFSVSKAFTSSLDALDYLKKHPVDVLLTDIMMPNMTGLELIAEVRSLKLPIECVVLSAYNDFSFAQAAIQYNVANYMLKPLNPEEVISLFSSLADRLTEEKKQRENQLRANRVLELSRTELVEKAVENFLRGIFWKEDTIAFLLSHYSCIQEMDSFAIAVWSSKKEELILKKRALQEWCQGKLNRTGVLFQSQGNNLWFLAVPPEVPIQKLLKEECKQLNIRVLMTETVSTLRECPDLLRKLLSVADQLFSMEPGQYKHLSALPREITTMPGLDFYVTAFSEAIQDQNTEAFSSTLSKFSADLSNVESSKELAAISLTDLCHNVSKNVAQGFHEDIPSFHQIFMQLNELHSFHAQRSYVEEFMHDLFDVRSAKQNQSTFVAQKIKQYIDAHYSEALSVSVLAKLFYFSSNYLSSIFHQQFGCSIPSYIKKVRLKKAQELLVYTDTYVQDIAVAVGIPNYRTFSQSFRETFSMTPMEYRTIYRLKQTK